MLSPGFHEASLCLPTGRTEDLQSVYVLIRLVLNSTVNQMASKESNNRVHQGNVHMEAGIKGECKLKSDAAKRK